MASLFVACDDGGSAPLTFAQTLDPATCADCHPDHYRQWSGSMHAYAAEDPVFRAMNARGQRETGGALGDFCIQCHAPLAVRMGLTVDGLNMDDVPPALHGITCAFCHQIDAVEGTHNNPLRVAMDGVMRAGVAEPVSAPHRSAYSPLHDREDLRSAALCGSCHDVVTPAGVHLERGYTEWLGSLFNSDDPKRKNTCNACHMHGRSGPIADVEGVPVRRQHDHAMPGVDVALTPFAEAEAQRDGVQRELDTVLVAELCVLPRTGGAEIEVALENVGAGHGVPSGAAHDRRFWVELRAFAGDEVIYESGVVGDGEPVAQLADPDLWLMNDRALTAQGATAHMFWDVASVLSDPLPAPPIGASSLPTFGGQHVVRRYVAFDASNPRTPDRVTMRVRARPIGLDVLDDLIDSGDLDPAVRAAMPTFDLEGTALEWTPDHADLRFTRLSGREALCVPIGF